MCLIDLLAVNVCDGTTKLWVDTWPAALIILPVDYEANVPACRMEMVAHPVINTEVVYFATEAFQENITRDNNQVPV